MNDNKELLCNSCGFLNAGYCEKGHCTFSHEVKGISLVYTHFENECVVDMELILEV